MSKLQVATTVNGERLKLHQISLSKNRFIVSKIHLKSELSNQLLP